MSRDREAQVWRAGWLVAVGAAAGLATGWALSRRGRLAGRLPGLGLSRLESRVEKALQEDERLRQRQIEVGALADGIVELSGTVRDEEDADRAVAVAQRVPGVRTVLNRLDIQILEDHLEDTRRRLEAGDPRVTETHWYGIGVGMGQRRQGHETDPDRPDDKVQIVSRELGANRAVEQASEPLDKIPAGVEGHTTLPAGPTDRGRVDDTSHRRLGNVPEEPLQDLHPEAGIHENVKKGTELTLEEAGLEEELRRRGSKDRS